MGFASLSDTALVTQGQVVKTNMTDNLLFPTPVPSLADFIDALEAYTEALAAAASGDKTKVSVKDEQKAELVEAETELANWVTFNANGDATMLISSGFTLAKDPEPQELQPPGDFKVNNGANAGQIKTSARRPRAARSYQHEYCTDVTVTEASVWAITPSTRIRNSYTGLESGKKHWFRVGAVGSNGQLLYSEMISKIVQ